MRENGETEGTAAPLGVPMGGGGSLEDAAAITEAPDLSSSLRLMRSPLYAANMSGVRPVESRPSGSAKSEDNCVSITLFPMLFPSCSAVPAGAC